VKECASGGESLAIEDRIGSLVEGREADIVAVDGNPLNDITAVRRVMFDEAWKAHRASPLMAVVAQNGSSARLRGAR
jgi:imidazolonepropionase-like amidohydrolase